jgi:hypothetical protein
MGPGQAPPPPTDGFEPVKGNEIEVLLLDATDTTKVLQRFTIPVQVRDPASYLRVEDVKFTPAVGARPNRLEMEIAPADIPAGPPVPVAATLPAQRNPDVLRVLDANLSGQLTPGGPPQILYAVNTTFTTVLGREGQPRAGLARVFSAGALPVPDTAGANVVITIAADGCERVFTFSGLLPPLGGTVRLNPVSAPRVQVRAKPLPLNPKEPPPPQPPLVGPQPKLEYREPVYASGLDPLPLELEVDNAPDGSTVQIRLGSVRPDPSSGTPRFVPDVTLPLAPGEPPIPAKDRSARIKFDKGDTLLLKGTLKDPAATLPVEVLVGSRVIEARLIGPNGQPLIGPEGNEVVGRTHVVFDGAKPTGVRILVDPRLPQGKVLTVRATSDLPVSGVREVKFFVGRPANDAPPPNAVPVPGVMFDPKANEWRATLPIEGLKGNQVIGVQFVSKAGQVRADAADVELIDPAEFNKPQPGSISGRVSDNNFAQPGLKVHLYDATAKWLGDTTTDENGVYEFKNLLPATYFVYCKNITRRELKRQVDLKPGAKEQADLDLVLPGRP